MSGYQQNKKNNNDNILNLLAENKRYDELNTILDKMDLKTLTKTCMSNKKIHEFCDEKKVLHNTFTKLLKKYVPIIASNDKLNQFNTEELLSIIKLTIPSLFLVYKNLLDFKDSKLPVRFVSEDFMRKLKHVEIYVQRHANPFLGIDYLVAPNYSTVGGEFRAEPGSQYDPRRIDKYLPFSRRNYITSKRIKILKEYNINLPKQISNARVRNIFYYILSSQ